jgi:hypothetical protein
VGVDDRDPLDEEGGQKQRQQDANPHHSPRPALRVITE